MKKLITTLLALCLTTTASFSDVKLGIIIGFTGPIESLTPDMAAGAELAIEEVNKSGSFSMGKVSGIRADSTCIDSSAATAAAERLITSDKVNGLMGADCSGVTTAILQQVALANGMVMVFLQPRRLYLLWKTITCSLELHHLMQDKVRLSRIYYRKKE